MPTDVIDTHTHTQFTIFHFFSVFSLFECDIQVCLCQLMYVFTSPKPIFAQRSVFICFNYFLTHFWLSSATNHTPTSSDIILVVDRSIDLDVTDKFNTHYNIWTMSMTACAVLKLIEHVYVFHETSRQLIKNLIFKSFEWSKNETHKILETFRKCAFREYPR